jgi:hypothetical protein
MLIQYDFGDFAGEDERNRLTPDVTPANIV